jgi:RNA polymerase sigma-70 factor (ECF subfamily)
MASTASDSITDEELAGIVARRDQAGGSMVSARSAFDQLYSRHALTLKAFLLARVARSDVDDLDQLVWLRVWRSLPKKEPGPFRAWVFEIARNAVYDRLRQKRPGSLVDGQVDAIVDGKLLQPEARLMELERKTALERCLTKLKPEIAMVVVRGRLSGEDYQSIAKAQGITPDRAYSLYHKAVKILQTCVERALS